MSLMPKYRRLGDQHGLTLVEVLVTLVIMSLVMVGSGIAFQAVAPGWRLEHAKTQIIADLKRMRIMSEISHESILLLPERHGYTIEKLSIKRHWPRNLEIMWPNGDQETGFILFGNANNENLSITLTNEKRTVTINIERLTGRVYAS